MSGNGLTATASRVQGRQQAQTAAGIVESGSSGFKQCFQVRPPRVLLPL